MKVEHCHPNNPNHRVRTGHMGHTCHVCGCISVWTDTHRCISRMVGKGYAGYEVEFITCSDECRHQEKQAFIDWLGKQPGWSVKSARENYEQSIENKIKQNDTR